MSFRPPTFPSTLSPSHFSKKKKKKKKKKKTHLFYLHISLPKDLLLQQLAYGLLEAFLFCW